MPKKPKKVEEITEVSEDIITPTEDIALTEIDIRPEMSQEEMENELQSRFDDIQAKEAEIEEQKTMDKDKIRELKLDIIRRLFTALEEMGVDTVAVKSKPKRRQKRKGGKNG